MRPATRDAVLWSTSVFMMTQAPTTYVTGTAVLDLELHLCLELHTNTPCCLPLQCLLLQHRLHPEGVAVVQDQRSLRSGGACMCRMRDRCVT